MYRISKGLLLLGIIVSVLALASSCKKEKSVGAYDTTYVDNSPDQVQIRNVLLEYFTGVRSVNCPSAHNTIGALEIAFPQQIVAVGLHTGFFSTPYPGRNDFRIPQGSSLENLLGGTLGYPAGSVNRKKFPNEDGILISDQKWNGYTTAELQGNSPININLYSVNDSRKNEVFVKVRTKLNIAQQAPLFLTLYLVEDFIQDFQLTPQGLDSNYLHMQILRHCITPYNGKALNSSTFEANRVFVNNFVFATNTAWNLTNCRIIAFVHRIGNQNDVLQASHLRLN